MNKTSLAILAGAAMIAGAVLYTNGVFNLEEEDAPYVAAVKSQLVDAESAQFRNVQKNRTLDIWCGEVNSKNRMGGYAGWQKFAAFAPTPSDSAWKVHFLTDEAMAMVSPCN